MLIRKYEPKDCKELTELFYDTVHCINAKDYTKKQLDVWADGNPDMKAWNRSLRSHYSVVALSDNIIVGFGDMDDKIGYLDCLYIHKDYQRKGIATAICDKLESVAAGTVFTHASVTARPFFEKRGYKVIKEQQVERKGILLKNYVMAKER